MKLLDRLFPDAIEMSRLRDRIRTLDEDRESLRKELSVARASENQARQSVSGLNAEVERFKVLVRSQTEADLFLTSARIVADILRSEKPKQEDLSRQAALQQQMACNSYNQQFPYYNGIGGNLGAILGYPT